MCMDDKKKLKKIQKEIAKLDRDILDKKNGIKGMKVVVREISESKTLKVDNKKLERLASMLE